MPDAVSMNHERAHLTHAVERALAHILAHNINNNLGAVCVLLELAAEDTQGAPQRLDPIARASAMAQAQVEALRLTIPKPAQATGTASFETIQPTLPALIGEGAARVTYSIPGHTTWTAERSVISLALALIIAHVAGTSRDQAVIVKLIGKDPKVHAVSITTSAPVPAMAWDQGLWPRVLECHQARLETVTDSDHGSGFILHWPISPL
jgi:hypothetical protein